MSEPRTIEEISGSKRIIREYDAAGQLLRIRIIPLKKGVTADLPPVTPHPRPDKSAARWLFGRRAKQAAKPEAAPPEASASLATPPAVRVRFADQPTPTEGIDVVVERVAPPVPPILIESPADEPAEEPAVDAEEPAPVPPVIFAQPEPAPEPRRRFVTFEIIAVEPAAPAADPEPERDPAPIVIAPEPVHAPPKELEPETVVVLAPEPEMQPPAPEPEPEREPEPPASYVALVPDVDERVDALLSRTDMPAKRRKRAPIPAPAFAPLQREPWEERLDAALGRS